MDFTEYERIQNISRRRIREVTLEKKRFLFDKIDWRDRLICIAGARGTGKTTMLLQKIKTDFQDAPDMALYASLDHLWFETTNLTGINF